MTTLPRADDDSSINRFSSAIIFIGIVWIVSILQLSGLTFDLIPKLLPRHISGLPGIITMPFLHGSVIHLLSNSFPLIIFSILLSLKGNKYYLTVTLPIIFLSGIMLWLFGRSAFHIGASALVFGYFGFLLTRSYYSPSISSILISLGVFIIYGGLIWGVLPQGNHISWEGHLFGLISGGIVAKAMEKSEFH